ncbi:MAG: hypothetical protein ABSB40_05895 [Nitrososphaeria archaeon]|jgi:hypothetical protein
MFFGQGNYTYNVIEGWGKHFYSPSVEVSGLAIDGKDNVYILTRGLDPVLVYDCNGSFIRCFWEGNLLVGHMAYALHQIVSFSLQTETIP